MSDPADNGFADYMLLTLHLLRVHLASSYAEIVDWASEMDRIGAVLQLARTAFPAPSTLWGSFKRVPTRLWRQLPDYSATRFDPSEHGALDITFFDREVASGHYVDHSNRPIWMLKMTALVDTGSCAVHNLHCSAHWSHDTQVGCRVALRNTDEIQSLAGDKGYQVQSLRDALRSEGVRPVIKNRLLAHYDHAHNALGRQRTLRAALVAESPFLATKRRYG